MGSKNVVAMFCKYPKAGNVKTRLGRDIGFREAALWYEKQMKAMIERLRTKEFDFVVCFSPVEKRDYFLSLHADVLAQRGSDLGERMFFCFEDLFGREKEYEKMLIIGSDIPGITVEIVERGFDLLGKTDVVIGPCVDGGYYLIGMKKAYDVFRGISWSTSEVFSSQVSNIERMGLSFSALAELRDVDTVEDL